MFSSLSIRNFRIYWIGMFVSLVGTWIQIIALSWLVFQLTDSEFLLGVTGFLSFIPVFLLSLFGGVAADRMNKRSILLFTQTVFMCLAFILAALTHLQIVRVPHIMFIALLSGVVMAFDAPSRQAIIVELVGKRYLLNAVALNAVAFNSSRMIGPALAGILVATIGMSGCFYINGISFLAMIVALLAIRIDSGRMGAAKNSLSKDLAEGLEFIRRHRAILILISMVGVTSLFGISYMILMPVFARNVLLVGMKGLGFLMSAVGIGALIAGLILAGLGDFPHKGRLLVFSSITFSISLILFSLSKSYLFSLGFLVLLGWAGVTTTAIINSLLQRLSPDEVRGRVMSAFMFTFAGIMPFGNLLAGSLAEAIGAPLTVALGGAICGLFFLIINLRFPDIRRI
ncbi:MFS transporter [Candidatus Omnitrophota bacterium]